MKLKRATTVNLVSSSRKFSQPFWQLSNGLMQLIAMVIDSLAWICWLVKDENKIQLCCWLLSLPLQKAFKKRIVWQRWFIAERQFCTCSNEAMFNAKFYARKGNQNVDSLCKMSFSLRKKCSFEATKRPYSLSTLCVSSEETSDVSQKTYFVESTFKNIRRKLGLCLVFLVRGHVFFHSFCFGIGSDGMLIPPKKNNIYI